MFRIILIMTVVCRAYGTGIWFRAPHQLDPLLKSGEFQPEFVLLKTGIFSRHGFLKDLHDDRNVAKLCHVGIPTIAWVTHRLSPNETLSAEVGAHLGKALSASLGKTCITEVELNIEPMPSPPIWVFAFIKSAKSELGRLKLRLTVPFVTESSIKGFHWGAKSAEKTSEVVDGIDILNYDSGCTATGCYIRLLNEGLDFAHYLLQKQANSSIIFGLPAYHDKTNLHHESVENPSVALQALRQYKKAKEVVCHGRFRIAFYAGWTMTASDKEYASQIQNWKKSLCTK